MSESRKSYWGGQHSLGNPYGKLVLERVSLDRGGYTRSGRYFGIGKPLYRVMNDSSEDGVVDFYIRASDRKAAIAEVRGMYPQAKIPGGGGGAPKPKRTRTTRSASKRSTSGRSRTLKRRALHRLRRVRSAIRKRGWGVMAARVRRGLTTEEAIRNPPKIGDEWRTKPAPGSRFQKGGDLYRRPMTRDQMLAPLAWHEKHMATVYRYGELADGTLGMRRVK